VRVAWGRAGAVAGIGLSVRDVTLRDGGLERPGLAPKNSVWDAGKDTKRPTLRRLRPNLADRDASRRPLSHSIINLYLSAVMRARHTAGRTFDRKHPLIARTWQGISRKKARKGGPRKAKPIMGSDLRDLIAGVDPAGSMIDARDAALLGLGWAAALRRSELVGLDWHELGSATDFVQIIERGLVVTLPPKGSQGEAVEIVIPCPDLPMRATRFKPGEPVFRWVDKGGNIVPGRFHL
jgi:integrase